MAYVPQAHDVRDKGGRQLVRARFFDDEGGLWLVYDNFGDTCGVVRTENGKFQAYAHGYKLPRVHKTTVDAIASLLAADERKEFLG